MEAVCELMPYSGGLTRNIVQCLEDFGIPLYLSTTVAQIHGKKRLEGVTVAQVDENRQIKPETSRYIPCDTLLLSVGLIPENELTRSAGIPMDNITGGALVDDGCQTAVPGIFACGNVLHVHDLVDYVSEEAERAGLSAADFVASHAQNLSYIHTAAGNGVRYVLPQRICKDRDSSLFLRVSEPKSNVRLVVSSGDAVLASYKRRKVAPGEIEKLPLTAAMLAQAGDKLTVTLEEVQ